MNESYERLFTLTNNLFDTTDHLKLSSILDFSQEISGNHADILGSGYDDFIKNNLIWIVARNHIKFIKPISYMHNLKVITQPLSQRFVEYPREVLIYDENNELLCVIKTVWMVLNNKTFSVETPYIYQNIDFNNINFYDDSRLRKLAQINKDNLKFERTIIVTYSMLDHNGHMNNTHYLDLYLDVFKKENDIDSIQIEYVKQAFLNDNISIYSFRDDSFNYLYGYIENDLCFYIHAKIKEL